MRRCRFPVVSLAVIALAAGCKPRDEIQVYQAPRDATTPATPAAAATPAAPAAPSRVPWTVPEGWAEKPTPPDGMRIASYGVTAADGRSMDVSVVPLGGTAGSILDNVNRWRDQIGLAPVTEADLASLRSPVAIGELTGELFDMAGDRPVLDGNRKARTLAAVFVAGDTTVFFKATGEEALVAENKPKFISWLKSVQTGGAPAPAAATASNPGSGPADMRGSVPPPPSTDLPQWQVPTGWKPVQASTMRLASFAVENPGGKPGDLSVVVLGSSAGGVLANVNRWRGQLGLPPIDEAALAKDSVSVTTTAGDQGVVVDLAGSGPSAGQRVLAAIVPRSDRTWFYKLSGDTALVNSQKEPFLGFIKSVKYP